MKIRKAEISDAEAILKINIETWHKAYKGLVSDEALAKHTYSPERAERWRGHIKNTLSGGTALYVAENEAGKVIGFAWGGVSRDKDVPRHMELYAFYVHPDEQKKGYGKGLFEAFRKYAAGHFYLYMLKDNQKSSGFYQRMGGALKPEYAKEKEIFGEAGLKEVCYFFE